MSEAIAVLHANYKQAPSDYTEARRRSVTSLRYMLANPVHVRLTKELQGVNDVISSLSAGFRMDISQISLGGFDVTQAAARQPPGHEDRGSLGTTVGCTWSLGKEEYVLPIADGPPRGMGPPHHPRDWLPT